MRFKTENMRTGDTGGRWYNTPVVVVRLGYYFLLTFTFADNTVSGVDII